MAPNDQRFQTVPRMSHKYAKLRQHAHQALSMNGLSSTARSTSPHDRSLQPTNYLSVIYLHETLSTCMKRYLPA